MKIRNKKENTQLNQSGISFRNIIELMKQIAEILDSRNFYHHIEYFDQVYQEKFLFVVMGEVNSGKSSFINRLLGEPLCKVDAIPTTDKINLIRGSGHKNIIFSDNSKTGKQKKHSDKPLEKKSLYFSILESSNPLLENISIVDTPGTNSIIPEHEKITADFLPASDLVIFIFPADNPFTGSPFAFLNDMVTKWNKEAVLVLNKIDHLQPGELEKIKARFSVYIQDTFHVRFPLFTVVSSCPNETDRTDRNKQDQFNDLRNYINERILENKLKTNEFQDKIKTTKTLVKQLEHELFLYSEQIEMEKQIFENFDSVSENLKQSLDQGKKLLFDNLKKIYFSKTDFYVHEIETSMKNLNPLRRLTGEYKKKMKNLRDEFNEQISKEFENQIRQWNNFQIETINLNIESLQNILEQYLLKSKKQSILKFFPSATYIHSNIKDLHQQLDSLHNTKFLDKPSQMIEKIDTNHSLFFSGIALSGISLASAILLPGLILVAGSLGFFLIGGGITFYSFSKIKKSGISSKKVLDQAWEKFEKDLSSQLDNHFSFLFQTLDNIFHPLFNDIEHHLSKEKKLQSLLDSIKDNLKQVAN